MGLINYSDNQTIFQKGTETNEIALIIKGQIIVSIGNFSFTCGSGSIVGLSEDPGSIRRFSYISKGETTVYTYPFKNHKDIIKIIETNEKLAPTITSMLLSNAKYIYQLCLSFHKKTAEEYKEFSEHLKEYPKLCAETGTPPKDFPDITDVVSPDFPPIFTEWKAKSITALAACNSILLNVYSQGTDACLSFVLNSIDFLSEVTKDIVLLNTSVSNFHHKILNFRNEYASLSSSASSIESGESQMTLPDFTNSLDQILTYSGYDGEKAAEFKRSVNSYVEAPNRTETTDNMRAIRRKISSHYYEIYKLVFYNSLDESNIPPIIKMFLLYGYMDERIVKEEDLKALYGYSVAYKYDGGKTISLYEWLKKIYSGRMEPSLNEFTQDYVTYLRECKSNGDISEEEMAEKMKDPQAKVDFEIKNLFTLGNKMVYGRISVFVPIFDSSLHMLPLEKSHIDNDNVQTEINKIRSIDPQIFYRTFIFRMPNNDSQQFIFHEEQKPYIITFPTPGSSILLWQTIDGRIRNSSARMMAPAFFDENLEDAIIKACADYRWEVCKTDQGVRWIDITDPSLTAEYNDFLQFYKKNRTLTAEHKEKIGTLVKKYSNNFKKVFINDYTTYIKYESQGNMRLLKQVREILFKYCPFSKEIRETLHTSPQYEKLIEIKQNKLDQTLRPYHNIIQKLSNSGQDYPKELEKEIELLEI